MQKVAALQFEGMKAYSYTDENVNGKVFYRLKMIDLDGSYRFTDIVAATTKCENQVSNLNLYPNPVGLEQSNISVSFLNKSESVVWVRLSDITGTELMKFPIDSAIGDNTLGVDISNLSEGTYFITIKKTKGKALTKKFIRVKN